MSTLTPQQAKNQIAVKYGYIEWSELLFSLLTGSIMSEDLEMYENEAMELYARAKCEEQKEICSKSYPSNGVYKEYRNDVKNSILTAPNACDKKE